MIPLQAINGCLIGYLFDGMGAHAVHDFNSAAQLAIASSQGRHLIERHCGAYIVFWREPWSGDLKVLRDPSGLQPALVATNAAASVIAADVDTLSRVGIGFDIDFNQLNHCLHHPAVPTRRLPITGVEELLPGELLTMSSGSKTRQLVWSPWEHVFRHSPKDLPLYASAIERTIDTVVAGWSSRLGPARLELSGGLDSSILAAALTRAEASWIGMTYATRNREGDERTYARAVAQSCGAPLREYAIVPDVQRLFEMPRRLIPRPVGTAALRMLDDAIVGDADRKQSLTLFSGAGGDNVFTAHVSTRLVTDAWLKGGRAAAHAALSDLARLVDAGRGAVAGRLVRRWLRTILPLVTSTQSTLLRKTCPPEQRHPWLDDSARGFGAATQQIRAIIGVHPILDG